MSKQERCVAEKMKSARRGQRNFVGDVGSKRDLIPKVSYLKREELNKGCLGGCQVASPKGRECAKCPSQATCTKVKDGVPCVMASRSAAQSEWEER